MDLFFTCLFSYFVITHSDEISEKLIERFEQKNSEKLPKGETDLGFMTIEWKERDDK